MSPPMKVGILTFHRCINYGSYWQARCLAEGLRRRGVDAVLMDHQSRRVDHAEWRCALKPLLPAATPREDVRLYAAKARKFFRSVAALPLTPPFPLEAPGDGGAYDAVVVGSDEVWNLAHPWYAGYPIFFGEGLKADQLVAYGASFGSHPADAGLESLWADRLKRFDAIGVRDHNSQRLVRQAVGVEAELVLDPCLQFDFVCRSPSPASGGFALVYGHSFAGWFADAARRWARARGIRLVSIGYGNAWADAQWIDAGPIDFAEAMGAADAVLTNFFHGCVFALANAKPFVCASSAYRSHKIDALVSIAGVRDRLATAETDGPAYDRALGSPLPAPAAGRLDALRRRSDAYLGQALH